MARKFNGTSDKIATPTLTLPGSTGVISYAWWGWNDRSITTADWLFTYGANQLYHNHGRSGSAGVSEVGMVDSGTFWTDSYPQPSQARWCHRCVISNKSGRTNTVYVDGVLQSLTTVSHTMGAGTLYSNAVLTVFSDASSGFTAGRIADLAIWAGVTINATEAARLAAGESPLAVHPTGLVGYWPIVGASPEPDYSGNAFDATVTGSTVVANPGVAELPLNLTSFPKALLAA